MSRDIEQKSLFVNLTRYYIDQQAGVGKTIFVLYNNGLLILLQDTSNGPYSFE